MRHRSVLVALALLATTVCMAQTGGASKEKPKGTALAPSDQMMVENSRATLEAYKNKDIAKIKALDADDYVAFTLAGPSTVKDDIDTIQKLTIESYTID